MNHKIFHSIDDFPKNHTDLLEDAEQISIFHGSRWFTLFEKKVATKNNRVKYYAIYANSIDSEVLAIFPMQTPKNSHRKLSSLSNYYASLFSPTFSSTANIQEIMDYFVAVIFREVPRWSVIDFKPMAQESEIYKMLVAALKSNKYWVQPYFCFGNWYLQLENRSYIEYFNSLSSRLRNTVKRKTKKLEKQATVNIQIVTHVDDVDAAMDKYEKIYAVSWKQDEPYKEFIRQLVRTYAEKDELRIGLITIDNEPAAAQIWFITHGIASIFKLAYDEKFSKQSVGSILSAKLMEYAIDNDKVYQIDYLTGDDPYKKEWMSHRRERWGVMAFNPKTITGTILAIRHITPKYIKRLINR
ncbi:MAG: GNAT family N-acetyltransferase [Thiohalomonadales bacterium]